LLLSDVRNGVLGPDDVVVLLLVNELGGDSSNVVDGLLGSRVGHVVDGKIPEVSRAGDISTVSAILKEILEAS
jgi:hypothetical protein